MRVVGRQFVLCFHCAMISLNAFRFRENIWVDVSLALLRRLEDRQVYDHEGRVVLAYWRVERQAMIQKITSSWCTILGARARG